jgi:alpha-L-rhamnosidase
MAVSITSLQAEHRESGFGIGVPSPRLSWRYGTTTLQGWQQSSYEIVIDRGGKQERYKVDSDASNLVPWPSAPLASREKVTVKVTSSGADGKSATSPKLHLEAGLFDKSDWKANLISGPRQDPDQPKPPFRLRKTFTLSSVPSSSRLYATAHGLYTVEVNGKPVGDHVLAPGWQSYNHHLNYQLYDISDLLVKGENVITAHLGEGWFATRLGKPGVRNLWGDRLGFLGQIEVDGQIVAVTDDSWDVLKSAVVNSEIYNGETVETTITDDKPTGKAQTLPFPSSKLIASDAPPVRRIKEVKPVELITTPSGRKVIDFGQNLVGWIRIEKDLKGSELVMRHAEVLEDGELGTRPLREAKATTTIKLGGPTKGWEPKFTFYGFRWVLTTSGRNLLIPSGTPRSLG